MPFFGGGGGGSVGPGTTNTIAKFTDTDEIGDSRITDDGSDIVVDSGAGTFEAGDTEFIGNGCQIEVDDATKKVYFQANGNGNFIQTLTLEGGDTAGTAILVAQGPGGTQTLLLDASNNITAITTAVFAPGATGATNLGQSSLAWKQLFIDSTITAGGATGDQTINKSAGSVNIAAGQSSITITCDKCTASSIVLAAIATNDATAIIKNVVPASGSFTVRTTAAVTAETRVNFWVLNQ